MSAGIASRMRKNRHNSGLIRALIATAFLLAMSHSVWAGQSSVPPLVMPGNQGSQNSTLELPTTPSHQGGELNIPTMPAPQQHQELTIPSPELREQPGYAQVTVTVTNPSDPNGYVTGLQKDDFKLYLDGQQRPIQFFRQDVNTPVSIGILVDTSGSMQPKIPQARLAIADFLDALNPRDELFLIAFSSRPYMLQPFTMDHDRVANRLMILQAFGQTSLFDAILQGLQIVRTGRYDKRALLVVTDGMDTSSSSRVEDVIAMAKRMGVLVYSIGIGDPNAKELPSISIGPFSLGGGGVERVDAATLTQLSTESGAKTYIIRQVGDGQMLRKACSQISLELREQYTLGFVAPDASAGGYRSVRVDSPTHPADTVRVRKGVEVGGPAAYAAEPGAPIR